jgi:signal transduction histidine kinase
MASLKNVKLISDIRPPFPKVSGVKEGIQQVLVNIVGNGIKFSPNDSEIIIKVQNCDDPGYVVFTISDHGPGIDENETSLIFHKYYRSKSIRKHMDGVGLGLYISKKIIQDLGGTISVRNNSETGSTFAFTLPEA